ncbi:hypothetical protein [Halobacteriovorax marinus]|uniref:hypothetical protein n=1 Tax=Halobacteriovorax marinus TaxID=97084 RepID=UPI003A95516C
MILFKWIIDLYLALILLLASKKKGMLKRIRKALVSLKEALSQEGVETREMFQIYSRYTQGKATKKEMKVANEQLRDIVKSLGLGVLLVLPFAPLTLPIIVKLGKRFGVDIIPSSFKKPEDD